MVQLSMAIQVEILFMEEILHHLRYKKLVNSGIDYLSTGARFFHHQQYLSLILDLGFHRKPL